MSSRRPYVIFFVCVCVCVFFVCFSFHNDEVDWMRALDALKRARLQLGELDLDKASGQNPPGFFDKVRSRHWYWWVV